MEYLSIEVNKKLQISDWTPFNNNCNSDDSHVRNIIQKGDSLTFGLSCLNSNGWEYLDSFINNGRTHFLLIKKENVYAKLSR